MAIRFDNPSDQLKRTANLPSYDANYTLAGWFYLVAHPGNGNYGCLFSISNGTRPDVDEFDVYGTGATTTVLKAYTLSNGSYVETVGSTALSLNTWYHVGVIRSANNSRIMYLNGVQEVNHTTSVSGRNAPAEMDIGESNGFTDVDLDGRVSAIKIWTAALSVAELQQEMYTIRPQRTANLHIWTPATIHTDTNDYSGNGYNWTVAGTLTTEDGPPISWGAPVWVPSFVASASAQTISPNAIASTATVYSPTVTAGAVTIAPNAISSAATVYAPTVTPGAVTISPNAIASTATVYAPTITTGAATITPDLIASTATVYVPTITPGAVTIAPAVVASMATVYAPDLLCNATIGGLLEVDSSNARYLRNTAGRLVLAGFHTWGNVQDSGGSYPPAAFDWDEYLDALVAKGNNFTKLWALETGRGWPSDIDQWFYPPRYVRTGPGNDNDGRLKFDLTQINPDYLTRLRTRAIEAGNAGVYVCVQLFNAWHISNKGLTYNPWTYHPYELANNINSVDGDQDNDGQGYDVNAVSGNVALLYQKALIEAMIDATADLDNVIYEICNESTGGARATAAQAWQEDLLDHAQTYLTGIGRSNLVGVTVMYPDGSNSWTDGTTGAWVSYNADKADLVHVATDPPSMYDTDHTTGGDDTHAWIFTAFCEGHGGLWLMDLWDSGAGGAGDMRADANYEIARRCLGDVIAYAAQIDLANATPQASLSTTGYCLAKTTGAAQLFVYQGGTGAFDVTLTSISGTFSLEWYRVSTGATQAGSNVNGGAVRTLTPPWSGEVVAFLEKAADLIEPNFISSAATVYSPTLTPGAVAIAPDAISSGATVYAPTIVAGAVTITPDLIVSVAVVYAPTLSGGTYTITPDAIASTVQVYDPTLTPGAVTIAPDAITSTATVYAPVLTSGVIIYPDAIASTATVYTPTITPGAITLAPDLVVSVAVVYAPTLTPGAVTIAPDAIDSAAQVYAPTVTSGAPTIYPDAIGSAVQVYDPTITPGAVTIAPDFIASTAVVYGPFIGNGTTQTIAPDFIASTAQVFAATLAGIVASRIYRVAAEDRTFAVRYEDRTWTVQGE